MMNEPLLVRVVSVSVRADPSPAELSLAEITGVSLVPVIVMVTVLLPLRGVMSSSVAVIV